jgi:hypothetical protein
MFERHTALNTFNLLVKFLNAMYAPWCTKMISMSTDGENTNTGHLNGLVTRFCHEASNVLLRVWCPPH